MEKSGCCVTLIFICHPACVLLSLWEDDTEKPKPALHPNPHHLDTHVAIYLLISTKIPLVCGLTWYIIYVTKDSNDEFMQIL